MIEIDLPVSKSLALRSMAIDYVKVLKAASDDLRPCEAGACDDVRYFDGALRKLLESARSGRSVEITIGDGAAPMRILTALAASTPGCDVTVIPSPQLAARPHNPLIDSLHSLGAVIEPSPVAEGALHIKGRRIAGGEVATEVSRSSQFATALMLASTLWRNGLSLRFNGRPVSSSYIEMTEEVMRRPEFPPEADWSAASYFYEWASLHPGVPIHLNGLISPEESLQGDSVCAETFSELGVKATIDNGGIVIEGSATSGRRLPFCRDCRDCPDLVPALAAALCFGGRRFCIEGVEHLRYKESDRIDSLAEALERLGFILTATQDSIAWDGRRVDTKDGAIIDCHGDHRIAMALCPAMAAGVPGIPRYDMLGMDCVRKSFPNFENQMKKLL